MAISSLDTAIKNAIESISYAINGNSGNCGWLLSARFKEGLMLSRSINHNVVFIQFIEETETQGRNDRIRKVFFYLFAKRGNTNDVFKLREMHDLLVEYIYTFQQNLSESYKCEFTGEMERLIDQLSVTPDVGITFSLNITDSYPC